VPLKAYDDITEMVRVGLLARIGEKYESTGISQAMTSSIASLAKEYPYVVSSKTILELLTYRHLLEVSALSAWTAFEAVMVGLVEGGEK
jgi:hypothetical protein